MSADPNPKPPEPEVRPHVYDGIREFNNRLPNWWLFTLYGAILFWVGYWAYYEWFKAAPEGAGSVEMEMTRIEAAKLAAAATANIDDGSLWAMSRNPVLVEAGRQTFDANCVACHLKSLRGKSESPAAIGPDLTDQAWIHGGNPTDLYRTVTEGVPVKGMPTWGPVLGAKRITEAVAYVLSHHRQGEPAVKEAAAPVPAQ
jgi:cytochrome c oxidase cbb3-type subunit 3